MKVIIDRFEGGFAVVEMEGKKFANLPRAVVPPEAVEGDVLDISVDSRETAERRKHAAELMKKVRKDDEKVPE